MSGGTMIAVVANKFVEGAFEWFAVVFFGLLLITAITQWAIHCYRYIKNSINKKD